MATSELYAEWFVPSLDVLTDLESTTPPRCVWHHARKTSKKPDGQLIPCSGKILRADLITSKILVQTLQVLWKVGAREYIDDYLKQIAPLLLCRTHRSLEAQSSILEYWGKELETQSTVSKKTSSTLETSRCSDSELRAIKSESGDTPGLPEVQQGNKTSPDGGSTSVDECGNSTRSDNEARATKIMAELASYLKFSNTALQLLDELAGLIKCPNYRQAKAPPELGERVLDCILEESPECGNRKTQSPPRTPLKRESTVGLGDYRTPPDSQASTGSSIGSLTWSPPERPRTPQSNITTPDTSIYTGKPPFGSPPSKINIHDTLPISTLKRSLTWPKAVLEHDSPASPSPLLRRTRAHAKADPNTPSKTPARICLFECLVSTRSKRAAAEYLMKKIEEKISVGEVDDGYVYGFRRPDCELIKIGFTTTSTERRMRDIERDCKYPPQLVFKVETKHAMKVERLVHRHLHRERRKEILVNEACNDGKGCKKRHHEWFEGISNEYAQSVVQAWAGWIELRPYDEEGRLKPMWIEQIKLLNLYGDGDIWMEWTAIRVPKEEITDRDQAEGQIIHIGPRVGSHIKPELESSKVLETSIVTTTEIKIEDDALDKADSSLSILHISG